MSLAGGLARTLGMGGLTGNTYNVLTRLVKVKAPTSCPVKEPRVYTCLSPAEKLWKCGKCGRTDILSRLAGHTSSDDTFKQLEFNWQELSQEAADAAI